MGFEDSLVTDIQRRQAIERQLGQPGSDVLVRFDFYNDTLNLQDINARWLVRNIGSSFILGHSAYGVLGAAGSSVLGAWGTGSFVEVAGQGMLI